MGTEIERRFVVSGHSWRDTVGASAGTSIRQGYLLREPGRTVRVRRAGDRGWLTIKGPGTSTRAEFEYEIPLADADELLATLCEPGVVDKTRYRVPVGGLVWEVDQFHGQHEGLVLAEVELPAEDVPVEVPAWVASEVTGDPAYTNAALSRPDSPTPPH